MREVREGPAWVQAVRQGWGAARESLFPRPKAVAPSPPLIGLALGGGFAKGIAHIGVLRVFEKHKIPIHAITGVSAGAIVAAAYAAGANTEEIERAARGMRFRDVARWTISLMGLADSGRMIPFLGRLLKATTFERMNIPLAVVASDIVAGKAIVFRGEGDVVLAIRASCSYPGLFQPVRHNGCCLVDGYVCCEVPTDPLRQMGVDRIIAVHLPVPTGGVDPHSFFAVVHRCFQVMGTRLDGEWRSQADLVIAPEVGHLPWDSFTSVAEMIELGERAALAALPEIERWLGREGSRPASVRERID